MAFAGVAQYHHVLAVAAFCKIKRPQIYPCVASHALVDAEFRATAFVPHGVAGIVDRVGYRLVTHIHCVAPFLGYLWLVDDLAHLLRGGRLRHACSTRVERILALMIMAGVHGETGRLGGLPF